MKKTFYKISVLFLAAILTVLLITGCAGRKPDESSSAEGQLTSTQDIDATKIRDSGRPGASTDNAHEYVPSKDHEAIETLSCISDFTNLEMFPIGNGRVLAYRNGGGELYASIVDIDKDEIVKETTFGINGTFINTHGNVLILNNFDTNQNFHVNDELEITNEVKVSFTNGVAGFDGKLYYGKDVYVMRTNLLTGEAEKIDMPENLYVSGVNGITSKGYLVCTVFINQERTNNCATAVVDPEKGELKLLADIGNSPYITGSNFSAFTFDKEASQDYICFGNLEQPESWFKVQSQIGDEYYINLCDAKYGLSLQPAGPKLMKFAPVCQIEDLSGYGIDGTASLLASVPELNAVLLHVGGDSGCCKVIYPEKLNFDGESIEAVSLGKTELISTDILNGLKAASVIPEVQDYLKDARARADELENTYGIKIFIGNQFEPQSNNIGFTLNTDFGDPDFEVYCINGALGSLEKMLRKFPEGFFLQFKDSEGNGGIRYIFANFLTGGTIPSAGGYEQKMINWYSVFVCAGESIQASLAHETMHAIEEKILGEKPELLNSQEWAKFNPEGFAYTNDFDNHYYDYDNTFIGDYSGAEIHFFDGYAKVNESEDRARTFEQNFCDNYEQEDAAARFFARQFPRAKMRCLCDAIRGGFDTSGWAEFGSYAWESFIVD